MLGEGGFGAVYKVWDDNLQRLCAIKENLQVSAEAVQASGADIGWRVPQKHGCSIEGNIVLGDNGINLVLTPSEYNQ